MKLAVNGSSTQCACPSVALHGLRMRDWMRLLIHENALSLVLFGLFLGSAVGQALTGWHANLEELRQHAEPSIAFADYLRSGHYISAMFENWESEFLQMGAYVLLTVFLRQKGSPESKK